MWTCLLWPITRADNNDTSNNEVCCGVLCRGFNPGSSGCFPFKYELWAAIQLHITGANPWCCARNSQPIHSTCSWWMKAIWVQGCQELAYSQCWCKVFLTHSFFWVWQGEDVMLEFPLPVKIIVYRKGPFVTLISQKWQLVIQHKRKKEWKC